MRGHTISEVLTLRAERDALAARVMELEQRCESLEFLRSELGAVNAVERACVKELLAYAKQADEALDEANKRCLARGNRIAKLEAALRKIESGVEHIGLDIGDQCDACDLDVRIARAALETK